MLCKCGSKKDYVECCGRLIEDGLLAKTPEQLMRSRYVAYSKAKIDYILATMQCRALDGFNEIEAKEWAQSVKWLKLEVVQTYQDEAGHGFVEFNAYYRHNNKKYCLHELSEFCQDSERWFYIGVADGK